MSSILPAQLFAQSASLVSPPDNIVLSDTNVSFTWNYDSAAVRYEFQLAQDAGFSLIVDSSSFIYITTHAFAVPGGFQAYYWRVRFYDGSAYSGWSSVRTFTIFDPSEISGLKLWLRSDTGVVLNSGNVSQWNDQSGAGNHAAQADTAAQPAFITNALNGLPMLRLVNDWLTTSTFDIGARSEFILIRQNGPTATTYHAILANPDAPYYQLYVPGSIFNSYVDAPINHNSVFSTSYQYISRVISATDVNFYNNGIAGVSGPHPATNTDQPIIIGNYGDTFGNFLNGDISEIVIYDYALPDSQRTRVEKYLNDRYAPPINLGPDITVCTFPITLTAYQDYYAGYLWSDASTADSLVVSAPGDYYVTVTNIFGFSSIDTVSVFLDNTNYSADLPTDTNICFGTTLILTAGPPHLLYQWSTGANTHFISIDTSGAYYVSITDCNSNISSDTIDVNVFPLPVFNLGNDTLICFNQPLLLDPQLGNSISYLWSDSSTDSILTVNSSGTYYLYVQDTIGCFYSDTVSIVVDSALAIASLGPDDSLCAGNEIGLVTGAAAAQSYLWSDGSSGTTLMILTTGLYWVTVTDSNGCAIKDTVDIFINGVAPSVNFSALTICEGDTTFFTDSSFVTLPDTVVSWSWNFGDPASGLNNFSSLQHPYHLYGDSGTYLVTLSDTTNMGCYNDTTIKVIVNPNPVPSFSYLLTPCTGTPLQFTNATDTVGVTSWQWNFGDPSSGVNNVSSLKNPSHTFNLAGNYNVTLTVLLNNGCSMTDTISVTVGLAAIPIFSYFNTCIGQTTQFVNGTLASASFIWNFGDLATSTNTNPTHQYAFAQAYNCTLTAITTPAGCTTSTAQTITIHELPVAHFRTPAACLNMPYQLLDSSYISQGTVNQWQWSFPDFTTSAQQNPFYTFNDTLQYNITLIAISDQLCRDTVTRPVKVHPLPTASFISDITYGDAPLPVDFSNLSSGAATYLWNFGDASGTSTLAEPSYTYTSLGTYPVTLIATTSFGCTDTVVKFIFVLEPLLDLAVTSIDELTGTNSISLSAGIANFGNVAVSDFKISAWLENSLPVFENWSGNLLPTVPMTYNFAANFETSPVNPPRVLCVEILEVNGGPDDNPDNNIRCINIGEDFIVIDPYPNPAQQIINLQVVVSRKDFLSIVVYDASGKLIKEVYNGLIAAGLNKFIFDISSLAEGTYFCKYTFSAETIVKPLTHVSVKK